MWTDRVLLESTRPVTSTTLLTSSTSEPLLLSNSHRDNVPFHLGCFSTDLSQHSVFWIAGDCLELSSIFADVRQSALP